MTWPSIKLRELCPKIGSGATPHGGAAVYIDAGTSLIRSQNVYNVKFEYEGLAHITADAAKRLDGVTVEPGDVLLNITGDSVARTCIVPDNVLPARVNQHVAIIRADPELLDYRYLNYYLASPFMQAHMLGLAVGKGASRNAITKAMIEDFSIPLPPLPVQRRNADILSAYDDLIENNRKQIKLLEEAAQRLYKEWFIDLRFPGHEHTPIVNGLPDGWEEKTLGNLIDFEIGGGWGSDFPTNEEDVPGYVIRGTDINGITHGSISTIPFRYHAKSNIAPRILKYGDIVFEVSGGSRNEGVGKAILIIKPLMSYFNSPVICASFCKLMRVGNLELAHYLYESIKFWRSCGRIGEFEKKSASSIINYRWKDFLDQQSVCIPSDAVMARYNDLMIPIYVKIINHSLTIEKNALMRDRLLPKLMNGEMEPLVKIADDISRIS